MPPAAPTKLVIIGAGAAGVFTAYLLEKFAPSCFDITILEKGSEVGGHTLSRAQTKGGQTVNIDGGAQFFSETAQPHYCAMLRGEGFFDAPSPIIERDVGVTLWNESSNKLLFRIPSVLSEILAAAVADPLNWLNFISLTVEAIKHHRFGGWDLTFGDWLDTVPLLIDAADAKAFKADIARPLMYQFGLVPPADLGGLSAKFVLFYYVGSLPWRGGAAPFSVYNSTIGLDGILEKLLARYGLTGAVKLAAKVVSVRRPGARYVVTLENGSTFDADHVVFAINPEWILPLLPTTSDFDAVRNVLAGMEYVSVPVHVQESGAPTYMPAGPHWSVSNVLVRRNPSGSPLNYMLSVWFGPLRAQAIAADFVKSWGSPGLAPPGVPETLEQTHHLMVGTPDFISRRKTLRSVHQGVHQLWYAGGYIVDYDSQNACLRSAVSVAFQLIFRCLLARLVARTASFALPPAADLDPPELLRAAAFKESPELLREIGHQIIAGNPDHPAVEAWLAGRGAGRDPGRRPSFEATLADRDAAEAMAEVGFLERPGLLQAIERQIVERNPEHRAVRAWLERRRRPH